MYCMVGVIMLVDTVGLCDVLIDPELGWSKPL